MHHTGKHFLPTWKAVLYSMNGNNPQLEQVVYTPRTSCRRNDWPRRSGELNPNSHISEYFLSSQRVPVDARTHLLPLRSEYLYTLQRRVAVSHPVCDVSLSRSARRSFAPLQKSHQEQKPYHVWFSCQRKSCSVNIA